MPLVTLSDLSIRYRGPALLDEVTCLIEPGQRIGLLGRNGSGKTTLMRMLAGEVEPDHGGIVFAPGTRVALLQQDVPQHVSGTVAEVVAGGVRPEELDHDTAWQAEQRVEQVLARMNLPGESEFQALSSGWKRRALLGRCLVSKPDLLLLDEPTNHLDVESITWLEEFLLRSNVTLMFVTHDRVFLRKLSNRILEIDRGRLFDWSCDYDTFLVRKENLLAGEEKQNALFDKKLAEEEVWIRTGIKARRTRNEGRVRALERMRLARSERRQVSGNVRMEIQEGERSGTLVAELDEISFAYAERPIVHEFSTTVLRGDKIGIIGPNGAGKTTLLRLLLGQLEPQAGKVKLGTNLQIAYFDQLRQVLDEEKSVAENVSDGYDMISVGGKSKHVIGYLQDFLFNPERARTPVKFLSGGERNRVLLAKLFAKPANVFVLDEPTNDLDAETLELLEERLVEFTGTVLLVSHDRAFLNNVATSTIVFESTGVKEYVGGYDDWVRQRFAPPVGSESKKEAEPAKKSDSPRGPAEVKRKLSYKEQQELGRLPELMQACEREIAAVHDLMAQPDFYRRSGEEIARETKRLADLEAQLATRFARWEVLESRTSR